MWTKLIKAEENEKVEGWSNYETWNVALTIDNDRDLYDKMVQYVKNNKEVDYDGLINALNLSNKKTMDNVSYTSDKLNKEELNEWVKQNQEDHQINVESAETDFSGTPEQELFDLMIDNGILTDSELQLITDGWGHNLETAQTALYVKTGLRTLEQLKEAIEDESL